MKTFMMRDIRQDGTVLISCTYSEQSGFPQGLYSQFGPGIYPDGPWDRQIRELPDGDWRTVGGRGADGAHWWYHGEAVIREHSWWE